MEFFDVLKTRQSIRSYTADPLEERKLQRILEAANSAPSAGNLQAYEIYTVRDASHRRALAQASLAQAFIAAAPVALVFCAHPSRAARQYGQRGINLYALQDATIACTYAMLSATAMGLATVWVGAFNDEQVREAIKAPIGILPVAILPIGYGAEKPKPAPRRQLKDLVHEVPG